MSAASPSDKEIDPSSCQINYHVLPVIKPKTYSLPHVNLIGMIGRLKQGKISEPLEQDFFGGNKREDFRQSYMPLQQGFRNNPPPPSLRDNPSSCRDGIIK